MGLFSGNACPACGKDIGVFNRSKVIINGVHLCTDCGTKIIKSGKPLHNQNGISMEEINEAIQLGERQIQFEIDEANRKIAENIERQNAFTPTHKISSYVWFDDNHKWIIIPNSLLVVSIKNQYVFKYGDILDFEVIEDGTTITKGGLGKALVGGTLFGVAGAIAGGTSKKTKEMCTKLQFKITTRIQKIPTIYINLITAQCKKDSFVYKTAYSTVQELLSWFKIAADQAASQENIQNIPVNNVAYSPADEIKKYKDLLDSGIITQEEFEVKKKELLNL